MVRSAFFGDFRLKKEENQLILPINQKSPRMYGLKAIYHDKIVMRNPSHNRYGK